MLFHRSRGRFVAAALGVSICLAAAPATAQQFAPSPLTLKALYDRIHRADGSQPAGAYCETLRTTSDKGSVTDTKSCWDGDDYVTTDREDGFEWASGSSRGQDWSRDANGLVTLNSGYYDEVDPFAVSLRTSDDTASGVKLLGLTTDPPAQYVVEIEPEQGLLERRYYDAQSFLLSRIEMRDYDGHTRVWHYSGYLPAFGRQVARSIDYGDDPNAKTSHTEVTGYQRQPAGAVSFSVPASTPLFDLAGRDEFTVPARFETEGVIVRVSIGGRGLDFLLDTGSSDILIDPTVARELGMQTSGAQRMSFAGDYTIANTRAPDFSIGDLRASSVALSSAVFEEPLEGTRIVGLLGTDFVGNGVLEVNFGKQQLVLHAKLPENLATQGWSMISIRLDDGVPEVKATFSGIDGHFIADLGADYSMLYPHYFDRFHITVPRGTQDQQQMEGIAGQPYGIKHFTMRSMVLGDWVFGGVDVTVPSSNAVQERDYDGLIGRSTLSNFNLIFDYKDRQLWFKPLDTGSPQR